MLGLITWNNAVGSRVKAGEEQAAALRELHVETVPENDSQRFLRIKDNQPLIAQLHKQTNRWKR